MEALHLLKTQNMLGEGPLWQQTEDAIYWVDIIGQTINRYTPGSGRHDRFEVDDQISVLGLRQEGGFVCAGRGGFYFWSPDENLLHPISNPEAGRPDSRFNDGKVDRQGRFWAGTMTPTGAVSSLYRVDADLSIKTMATSITISNGIGWSPDNQKMYYVDSLRYVMYVYDYDIGSGEITNRRTFIEVTPDYGIPDGLTVDSEGCVWCAFYGGAKVTRFDPNGKIIIEVPLPVTQPTSCAFGGEDFRDLFITSASDGLRKAQRNAQAQAGDLFVVHTDTRGIPEPFFLG